MWAHLVLQNQSNVQEAETDFDFEWSRQDEEDLRWYLEDYLIYPADPAPTVAARVVGRIESAGAELFLAVFRKNAGVSKVWDLAAEDLADLRIEISSSDSDPMRLPWETLREPASQSLLAISCHSFVRVHSSPSRGLVKPAVAGKLVRLLLVICRPAGAGDVPFRSVAGHLLKGMHGARNCNVHIDVLRPPTYGQLSSVLRKAAQVGEPYHVVHFDGHGLTGGLVFENPNSAENREIIDGGRVGKLLADAKVPILVLNACRSAFAEPQLRPRNASDIQVDIRMFGSLAQVVADQGIPCVLAMRFNVFVETAARFMLDFYSALVTGVSGGEAVQLARAQLSADPIRQSFPRNVPLEDWIVPVLYEAVPLRLFAAGAQAQTSPSEGDAADRDDIELPRRPDAGFFGRDETLLALDRAFDFAPVVLLHAYAGSGKTTTAAEFARWYLQTAGTRGPLLFTSFDTKRTLGQIVDQLGRRFAPWLLEKGIQWDAMMDPGERLMLALSLVTTGGVFWIWDNVEPVGGFPAGSESAWSLEEQTELANFLRDASERGAKFLLTSRRDESAWLGMLPSRVAMPPMPLRERVQLTQALMKKMGRPIDYVEDWRPLLDFTQGNPLAVTLLVVHALRNRLRTAAEIGRFVSELQSGAANLQDDPVQGRSRSLTASLNYGLEHAFSQADRKAFSMLHFFQGYANSQVFEALGVGIKGLPEIGSLSLSRITQIFEVGVELGILERHGDSENVFRIHPAVPWFFRVAFERDFQGREQECKYAFVRAMGLFGSSASKLFNGGDFAAAAQLIAIEEANLRYALKLAVELGDWFSVLATMHPLEDLYTQIQGNKTEWHKLIGVIGPLVTDANTGKPIPGREMAWVAVTEYRMRDAHDRRELAEAARLAQYSIDFWHPQADEFLADPAKLAEGNETIHNLAVAVQSRAMYLIGQGSEEGVELYEEGFRLSQKNGDNRQAAICAQGLGWAYRDLPSIRDLQTALEWFGKAYQLAPDDDAATKGKSILMAGSIYHLQFQEAFDKSDKTAAPALGQMAITALSAALDLLSEFAYRDRAEAFGNLGTIHLLVGDLPGALVLCQQALEFARKAGAFDFETVALLNIASVFKEQGRLADSLTYAAAAEKAAEAWGLAGQSMAIEALQLMASIRAAQKAARGGQT
jgi:tetratricopeptide (TPR) repeat protein